tara:strand:- start:8823 stop:9614 length:792 start_codon:yes stop_codon:yes gene_type:complete
MKISPIQKDSLIRMTIYDLGTLLNSLKGVQTKTPQLDPSRVPQKPVSKRKSKRSVAREIKEELEEGDDNDLNEFLEDISPQDIAGNEVDIPATIPTQDIAGNEVEVPVENIVLTKEDIEEEESEEEEEIEKPKPKPKPKAKKKAKKKAKVEIEEEEEEEDIPQPTPLKRTRKKVVNETTQTKDILSVFRKNVSKLVQNYKKVRFPKEHHRDKLILLYNQLYDDTCDEVHDTLESYQFVDDEIYEYANGMLDKEKVRIARLVGE